MTEALKNSTRLMLMTPAVEDAVAFAPRLEAACRAGDVAAVVLDLPVTDEVKALSEVRIIASHLEGTGAVLMLANRPSLTEPSGADGAHFTSLDELQTTRTKLAIGRLAGVGGLQSRHDAMVAAESGVDYVMFGEPDASGKRPGLSALVERVSWWAEIFQMPCVAYAASLEEIAELADARADFIALGDAVWKAEKPADAVERATQSLRVPEPAE